MNDRSIPYDTWEGVLLAHLVSNPALGMQLVNRADTTDSALIIGAHATEMVDPRPYVRPGELVCTVGSTLVSAENCYRFVRTVKAAGATGICLGLGEIHTQAPPELREACQEEELTLIEMATGVPFLSITEVLVTARVRARTATTKRDEQLIERLLTHLHNGDDIDAMLASAGELLGGELLLWPHGAAQLPLVRKGVTHDPSEATLRVDLASGEELQWFSDDPFAASAAGVLQQVGRVLQISRRDLLKNRETASQRVGQLFTLVADGLAHPEAASPELEKQGMKGLPITVSAWPAGTFSALTAALPAALIADAGQLVFVVSTSSSAAREAAEALGLICGYSSTVRLGELERGLAESRATLLLARKKGHICGPGSLSSLDALLEQQSPALLAPFITQLIDPLLDRSVRGGDGMLRTLRTFLACGGSLQITAKSEYLHVNTVRHRLGRVREIVGRNPFNTADLTDLQIAIWAFDRTNRRRQ